MKNKLSIFLFSLFGGALAFFISQFALDTSSLKESEIEENNARENIIPPSFNAANPNRIINSSNLDFTIAA